MAGREARNPRIGGWAGVRQVVVSGMEILIGRLWIQSHSVWDREAGLQSWQDWEDQEGEGSSPGRQ